MIVLYDTTLRDGTQREGLSLSLADKLKIARRLDEAGFPYIEGGWPGSNPKDEEFFAAARSMTFRHAKLAAFGSTRHRSNSAEDDPNLRALIAAETPVTTIFGKSWLLHVTDVLGATADENLAMIGDSVAFLRGAGREVIYDAEHFFDGYKDDAAYALATLRAAIEAGATTVALCDTNGGCLTDEIAAMTRSVGAELGTGVTLGIHVHDDAGLAVANSLAAVQAGASHVQGTINGYGERCGNANLVTIWANLALKLGLETVPGGDDLTHLPELSRFVAEVANIAPDAHQPYVGTSAFAHKGGVHGAATARVEQAYQHVDPVIVGGTSRLVVSELGGRANAAWRVRQLGPLATEGMDPAELSRVVKQLESEGASFEGADASFELLVRRRRADYVAPFRIVDFTVIVERRNGAAPRAEASVKVEVDGEVLHTAADGNGPVNALDLAMRKALGAFYPALDEVHLVDYKVRILDGDAATAARTQSDHRDRARDRDAGSRPAPTRTSSPHQWRPSTTRSSSPSGVSTRDRSDGTSEAPRTRRIGARGRPPERRHDRRRASEGVGLSRHRRLRLLRGRGRAHRRGEGEHRHPHLQLRHRRVRGHPRVPAGRRRHLASCSRASTTSECCATRAWCAHRFPSRRRSCVEITLELLRRNAHEGDVYIRPLIYKSARSIRVKLTGLDDRVGIFTMPLGDYLPTGGIRLTVSGWQRVSDNAIPARGKISGSYVNAAFAAEDAHAAGYDDAILLTGDGHVAEASAANLFVVVGREVATPPLTDDVLAGITRSAIMQIAADAGLEVVERRIDRSELYLADEVFLTGTGVQVAPVSSIDDRPVGNGEFPTSARHPAPLLRGRARQRRSLRALAHPDLTIRRASARRREPQGDSNR